MAEYRLTEQKIAEAEYLFQTIEMANSDEESVCGRSPPRRTDLFTDLDLVQEPSIVSWKVVKRRQRSRRRYTFSHSIGAPPAPPSTPTSLTATATPTPSPTTSSSTTTTTTTNGTSIQPNNGVIAGEDERLKSLLYILDYAPKYKKKLKEQQRTDAELAALFNVITLSNNGVDGGNNGGISNSSAKITPLEHRICAASRSIRKPATSTKIFKIHRNPKEFFRDQEHEEDSVSAPEYDDAEERENHSSRYKRQRRSILFAVRQRRIARFEQQERMETMMHDFGNAMTFNEV